MHKFFIPQENIDGETAVIDGEDVKHIYKVLRLEEGDQVSLNDCKGADYLAEITDVN
ncbi:MAG TPA: RNA methyltransferase PUA domain-containing protein, partial [Clostridiaceae bacterium]|nr:RNA methyltransferase PUA domain-containing protein [Clostridiaceae bacterium]